MVDMLITVHTIGLNVGLLASGALTLEKITYNPKGKLDTIR